MMETNFGHACGLFFCGPGYMLIWEPVLLSVILAGVLAPLISWLSSESPKTNKEEA